jgi:hypothetical protein
MLERERGESEGLREGRYVDQDCEQDELEHDSGPQNPVVRDPCVRWRVSSLSAQKTN